MTQPEPIIHPQRLQVIHSALEDCRRLIAALKIQRWEVLKWVFALEVALATVSKTKPLEEHIRAIIAVEWLVAFAGFGLIFYYCIRARNARMDAMYREDQLWSVERPYRNDVCIHPQSVWYDWQELLAFGLVLFGSVMCLTFVAYFG